jgi:hypothetical protein
MNVIYKKENKMSEIIRYRGSDGYVQDAEGPLVKYTDYQTLQAEVEKLEGLLYSMFWHGMEQGFEMGQEDTLYSPKIRYKKHLDVLVEDEELTREEADNLKAKAEGVSDE